MNTGKHFKVITCDSGTKEILLEDGELYTCGNSIGNNAWISILRSLGCTVEEICVSDNDMQELITGNKYSV